MRFLVIIAIVFGLGFSSFVSSVNAGGTPPERQPENFMIDVIWGANTWPYGLPDQRTASWQAIGTPGTTISVSLGDQEQQRKIADEFDWFRTRGYFAHPFFGDQTMTISLPYAGLLNVVTSTRNAAVCDDFIQLSFHREGNWSYGTASLPKMPLSVSLDGGPMSAPKSLESITVLRSQGTIDLYTADGRKCAGLSWNMPFMRVPLEVTRAGKYPHNPSFLFSGQWFLVGRGFLEEGVEPRDYHLTLVLADGRKLDLGDREIYLAKWMPTALVFEAPAEITTPQVVTAIVKVGQREVKFDFLAPPLER